MSRVGYVCMEESVDTIFDMGCGGGAYSAMDEKVKLS